MAPARFKDVALDAVDHHRLADWWCAALGYERRQRRGEEWPESWPVPIRDPHGRGPTIWVNPMPDGEEGVRRAPGRMRLDVRGETEELLAMGATLVRARDDEAGPWDVLADPEGNEFWVFPPRPPAPPVRLRVR